MTVLQGILLGILQGVAEFLPISSSGHLKVCQALFKLDDVPLFFDVVLHIATLLAVCIYFRKKIIRLFAIFFSWILRKPSNQPEISEDLLSGNDKLGQRNIIAVIITTFVTAVIGIFTSKLINDELVTVKMTCAGFIVTAALLFVSFLYEKKSAKKAADGVKAVQALVIGVMQGIGTLPGISRSGSTIAGSQLCGVNRELAGEYSFIVSIPAILGAFVLELKDLDQVTETVGAAPLAAGCVAAFVAGYFALSCLMKIIKKGKLVWFAAYLVPAGILGILFL